MPKRPLPATPAPVNGERTKDNCPMCGEPLATDDHVICCNECGGEGCTEHCIPGGQGTACVDCESADG